MRSSFDARGGWRWRFRCFRGCRGGTLCKWCIRGNWAIVSVRNDDFLVNFEPWPWLTDHHTVEPLLHDSISRNLRPSFDLLYLLLGFPAFTRGRNSDLISSSPRSVEGGSVWNNSNRVGYV